VPKCRGCDDDDLEPEELCPKCSSCDWCCACDDALFDADELGLDPEEDDERA
jgi:hypothetical protein